MMPARGSQRERMACLPDDNATTKDMTYNNRNVYNKKMYTKSYNGTFDMMSLSMFNCPY